MVLMFCLLFLEHDRLSQVLRHKQLAIRRLYSPVDGPEMPKLPYMGKCDAVIESQHIRETA